MVFPDYALAFALIMGSVLFVSISSSAIFHWFLLLANTIVKLQLRLLYILPAINPTRPLPRKRGTPTHLLIVLGSGGHTAEMLSLLADLDPSSYTHRTYIISSGDDFSASKAVDFERNLTSQPRSRMNTTSDRSHETSQRQTAKSSSYSLHFVPRARKIHQSLLTAPFSCLQCFIACIRLLYSPPLSTSSIHAHSYPDLILLNGPSNSVLVLLAALFLRFFAFSGTSGKMRSIYVESWARVKGLSLSGKILVTLGAVDRVLVQWEGLAEKGKGEFRGCLVK